MDAALPKHKRYKDAYLPGEVYWGLGIELETYVELLGGADAVADFARLNQRRERYSVDYWSIYKPGTVDSVLQSWIAGLPEGGRTPMNFPLLMNAHTFGKTDRFGEPALTYAKVPCPNPKFSGTTLLEDLSGVCDGRDVWWTFDGDTVEFMTQGYYCAKMEDVIDELLAHKRRWLTELQRGLDALPDKEVALRRRVSYPVKNHGLAVYLTNRSHIGIFNNGTYHFNITLPTYLDKDCCVADMSDFTVRHQRLARLFQWMEPLLVARFGSGDVFSTLAGGSGRFPAGSQRLCASRFVGVGTYNTEAMERGKILTIDNVRRPGRWYETIYDMSGCAYTALPKLGLDINFNKHWNHGLEFRIFDWFPESELSHMFRLLIWMCDESSAVASVADPLRDPIWNNVLARAVWSGAVGILSEEEAMVFGRVLRAPFKSGMSLIDAYNTVWRTWAERWNCAPPRSCTAAMIRTPLDLEAVKKPDVHISPTTPTTPQCSPKRPVRPLPPVPPPNVPPTFTSSDTNTNGTEKKKLLEIPEVGVTSDRSWRNLWGCMPDCRGSRPKKLPLK